MRKYLLPALAGLTAVFALSACSTTDENGGSTRVNMETATVITNSSKASECISPIRVYEVDGKQFTTPLQKFDLQPGQHTMKGNALITGAFCRKMGVSTGSSPLEPLTYNFEAGKTYFVGVNHKASSERQWFLTVWDVQDK